MSKFFNRTKVKVSGYGPIKVGYNKTRPIHVILTVNGDIDKLDDDAGIGRVTTMLTRQELEALVMALDEAADAIGEYAFDNGE